MQGETDGARRTSAAAYHAQLQKLMTLAPQLRWLMTKESICYDVQTKWTPLDAARERLARERSNVTIGPDLDSIPLAQRQGDKCHLTPEGQELLATALANAARPLLDAQ